MTEEIESHNPIRGGRFDTPEQEVYLNLWRTYDCLKALEDQLFSQYDLSAQQYNALRLLKAAGESGLQTLALARRLISRSPDITRMLDRLEKRGFISRERKSENRRVVEVVITQEGMNLLTEMQDSVRGMHCKQLSHLSEDDQKQLSRLLKLARKPHEDETCDWL